MGDVFRELEEKLDKIKQIKGKLEKIRKEADEEIGRVKSRYNSRIQKLKGSLDGLDKDVKIIMRKHKDEIFKDDQPVKLKCAVLYRKIRQVVKRARGVSVKLLEQLGYTDGIKIEKRVDWEAINSWPDEKLTAIGTERIIKEDFQYDLTDCSFRR